MRDYEYNVFEDWFSQSELFFDFELSARSKAVFYLRHVLYNDRTLACTCRTQGSEDTNNDRYIAIDANAKLADC